MPIYMDFHDLPDGVTAEHVARMHQADLEIEHKYNCRGLTYWCDEIRQTAFCLIEAPNKEAIIELHDKAHGGVPQRIIEVNDVIVESFLGRIADPEKSRNLKLNIINDPAFRTLMVVKLERKKLRIQEVSTLEAAIRGYSKSISNIVESNDGRLVKHNKLSFLMSFNSVSDAVHSALDILKLYNCVITPDLQFNIGISAGIPVTEKEQIFEETIRSANFLSQISNGGIIVSDEVRQLFESENRNQSIPEIVQYLSRSDEEFLIDLMEQVESIWPHSNIGAGDLHSSLGFSKSGFYRQMKSVINKSPNTFLKEIRLANALELLDKNESNISEVAYRSGFSSPAYFTKCFQDQFGVLPSAYLNSH